MLMNFDLNWLKILSKCVIVNCDLHGDLQCGSLGSFSSDICRLLQLCEEEDDATSALAAPKPEPNDQSLPVGDTAAFQEVISLYP